MYQTFKRLQRILSRKGVQGLSSPCFDYFKRNKQHVFGGLVVLCIFALIIPSTIITTSKKFAEVVPNGELKEYKEFHDMIDSGEGIAQDTSTPFGMCTVHRPSHPKTATNPILVATFPGSSSDLMRLLIETVTGVWTSARTFRDDVVAIKTHYPYYDSHISLNNLAGNVGEQTTRGILVLRDPMDTFKIFYSYIQMISKKRGGETDDWEKWRDVHFHDQLKHWEDFMRYWLGNDLLAPETRHVVIHEKLVGNDGHLAARELGEFLKRSSGFPADVESVNVPCLWHRVVTFQLQVEPERRQLTVEPENRRLRQVSDIEGVEDFEEPADEDPMDLSYTYSQLDKIAAILTQLIDDLELDESTLQALMNYRISALESMQRLLGDDPILVSNGRGTCMVTTPQYEAMIPMFQASYPGSGSEMMRDLIEAITGVKTSETKRRNDVVAIKTFYPVRSFDIHPSMLNRDMQKAVLIVRCPLHAISSNFNHIYWRQNNLDPHSIQPPKELWEQWRDEHFEKELHAWVDHLVYWMRNFKTSSRLIVSYESLTDRDSGPQDAMRLALFIRASFNEGIINPAPAFTLPCLWFRAVRQLDLTNSDMFQDNSNHAGGDYHPAFSTLQLEKAATELNSLLMKYSTEKRLAPILQKYWEHVVNQIN